jgi:hypothetical protein
LRICPNTGFYKIFFFENEFNGVMPLEIMVDTQRKKGVMKLSTLRRWMNFKLLLKKFRIIKPISILNLVKYSKQAYYNGNPEYYDLPTLKNKASY